MLYLCTAGCNNPAHSHGVGAGGRARAATPLARAATASRPVVKSRKGSSKVIDLHCHYLNPAVNAKTAHLYAGQYDATVIFADELTRQTNAQQMASRAPKMTGVTERLRDMDRMGVDIQAVCPAPYHFFYFTEAAYGAELAREVKEGIAQLVAGTPDRFVGLGSVPLRNCELAVRKLDFAVKNLGLRGVEICTNVNGKNLTDPRLKLDAFFARCEELGVLIFMNSLGYTQGERLTNHYFSNVIGNPLESTVAVAPTTWCWAPTTRTTWPVTTRWTRWPA